MYCRKLYKHILECLLCLTKFNKLTEATYHTRVYIFVRCSYIVCFEPIHVYSVWLDAVNKEVSK